MPDELNVDPSVAELVDPARLPAVEMRSAAHVSNVDFAERIITVISMPYEQMTQVPFRGQIWNEVFSRSAFHGIDASKRRVPVTACLEVPDQSHSGGRAVGKAVRFDPDHPEGLLTDLKISRTPAGDETLELANDGAIAISSGFMVKNRLDQSLDTGTRTRRVNRAFLDHIACLADQPAYAGAKVLSVRSDGSMDLGGELNPSPTPSLDDYLNDPIFQWTTDRLSGRNS